MSDQGFYLQIIDRTSFYDLLFSYPNITLLILKTLTFVFKITYYFEVSNFHNFLYLYLKILTQVSRCPTLVLTFKAPIPQNGQTHSKTFKTNCLSVLDHFVKLALKGLNC